MSRCKYIKGGSKKYILTEAFMVTLKSKPKANIFLPYTTFLASGILYIRKGYEWDGPSGPAIDTDNFMDGSLIHDLLYQLMREGHLNRWGWRAKADKEMRRQCKKDGMSLPRRWYTWLGVRIFGFGASGGRLPWQKRN